MRYEHPVGTEERVAGDNYIGALGQWAANAPETFPAHNDMVFEGGFFEINQIGGQVPGYLVVFSNNAVFGNGYYRGDNHKQNLK
jgi:hypothetical protein